MAELSLYTLSNKMDANQTAINNKVDLVNTNLTNTINANYTTLNTKIDTTKSTLDTKINTINTNLTNSITSTNTTLTNHNHSGQTLTLGGLKLTNNFETGWSGWNYALELNNGGQAAIINKDAGLGIGFHTDGSIYFLDVKNGKYLATLANNGTLTANNFSGTSSYATSAGNADTVDGKHASDLSPAGHHHDNTTLDNIDWTKILNKPATYVANGGNSDTVDGYHASDFVKATSWCVGSTAPTYAVANQTIWFHTTNRLIYYWNGSSWIPFGAVYLN